MNEHKYQLQDDLPLLTAAPAFIKCSVLGIMENGDHPLFLSEVKNAVVEKELHPLQLKATGWYYGG